MPREIKTTIAVDGEAAFKRAINDANTSMRNLGTQLTLAQAQFKKDGDAMKLMETRSKALKSEIDQQEKIVTALEKAVEECAEVFEEGSQKTEKWEAELNRAKAKLANLQSELTLNDAGLDRNGKSFDESSQKAADYQATLQTIGKNVSFQSVTEGISGITGKVESATRKVISFAREIRETFVDAGKWADELLTDATKYGMDVETLQAWQNAADFIDTDVTAIITAWDRVGKKMKNGWKDGTIDMWEMLGIDLHDAETGAWRDKMDVMWELGETLMNMTKIDGDDVRADAYAMEVFGKSWRELMPLFTAGREEWEKTVAEQKVVSEERVKALGELDDANQALENSWDVTKYSFLAELSPTITEVTEAVTEMLKAFNEWMDTDEGKKAMEDLSAAITSLFSGLKDVSFTDAIETAKTAINGIKDALVWLSEHKDDVFGALKVIAGGFVLLKATETAAAIGRIVSGLGGLTGGGKKTSYPSTNQGIAGSGGNAAADAGSGGNAAADAGAAAGGTGSALLGGKNALKGKLLDLSSWTNAFNMINAGFVNDWFFHNTETGRSINPEYGNSFSFENLWNGFWTSVNNQIEENRRAQEAYESGETWSILDPASKERYDKKQAQDAFEEAAREYHAEHTEPTMTAEEWEAMSRSGRDLYMKLHPMPTQEEMNQEYLSGTTYWNAAPGSETFAGNKELLSDAVAEMRINTESTKASADKIAGADFKRFNNLPAEIQAAAQRGTANGVSRIQVQLDGYTVGRLIAPVVSNWIASYAQ